MVCMKSTEYCRDCIHHYSFQVAKMAPELEPYTDWCALGKTQVRNFIEECKTDNLREND